MMAYNTFGWIHVVSTSQNNTELAEPINSMFRWYRNAAKCYSNPLFYNRNTLWSSEPSRSIPSLNASGSQRIHRPTATLSHSGYQIEAERNTAARAEGTWTSYTESEFVLCTSADNDDESDDDLPSLEE
jgi:hypothetical protein